MQINLLPWRKKLIDQHKKQFWLSCSFAFLVLIILVFSFHTFLTHSLHVQQNRNERLNQEITKQNNHLEIIAMQQKEIKILEKKLDSISQLKEQKNNAIALLNLLPEVVPKDVVLEKISMKKRLVQIEGRGLNNLSLATMLSLLEKHSQIQNVKIHSIVNHGETGLSHFKATFDLLNYVKLILEEHG